MIRILSQRVSAVDKQGLFGSDWFSFFSNWVKDYNRKQSASLVSRYSLTGTTTATKAASCNITLGNNGWMRLSLATGATSNANAKTVTVAFGGHTIMTASIDASTAMQSIVVMMCCRGKNDQFVWVESAKNMTASNTTTALDLSSPTILTITLQLGNSADTITLESYALNAESA